ncbi:MAG: hypothetical protein ACRCZK_02750 [Oscillospiraceae bacterium]
MKIMITLALFLMFLLTGCFKKDVEWSDYIQMMSLKPGEVVEIKNDDFIYNNFDIRLYKVDLDNRKFLTYDYDKKTRSVFQSNFGLRSKYYISGSSFDYGFKLLKNNGTNVEVVFEPKKDKGLETILHSGTKIYFNYSTTAYDKDAKAYYDIDRKISVFDTETKEFKVFENTSGLIVRGTLIGDDLYYNEYLEDKSNSDISYYNIYKLNITDINNKPLLVEKNVNDPVVFSYKGELWKKNDRNNIVYRDENNFVESINTIDYFDEKTGLIIQYYTSRQAGPAIKIVDIETKKVVFNIEEVFSLYISEDNILNIVMNNATSEKVDLNNIKNIV